MRLAIALVFALLAAWAVPAGPALGQGLPGQGDTARLRPLTTLAERLPWQAIGRLDTGRGFCTATLIDADTVLTAAHCLYDRATGARIADAALTFRAGLSEGQAAATRAVAASAITAEYAFAAMASTERVSRDVALLRLAAPIRTAEIRPLAVGAAPDAGEAVMLVSYGRDRSEVASMEAGCGVRGRTGGVIVLDCRVDPGSSGAPVIALRQGQPRVVSVVSAAADADGEAVGLAAEAAGQVAALRPGLMAPPARDATLPQVRTLGGGSDGRDTVGARFVRP